MSFDPEGIRRAVTQVMPDFTMDYRVGKQLLTKVRSFIVTVLSRRLNIRLVLLQPLRHQLISQNEQVPTRI